MTSQNDRTQALIEQIRAILANSAAEGDLSSEVSEVLEQTAQQLSQLQQASTVPIPSARASGEELPVAVGDWQAPAPVLAESAQQVLQAILQEMSYLRMNTVQPLREEVTQLQQQRQRLASEINQLEQQRQQLLVAQQTDQQKMINGFLHALMGRLQDQLTLQVAQTIATLEGDSGAASLAADPSKVVQLNSTLRVVFDSLQTSVDTYQDALEESLRKMHNLGQQGEAMFTAFVNRLASQLGREASQYLQPPSDWTLPLGEEDPTSGDALLGSDSDTAASPRTRGEKDEIASDYLEQLLDQPTQEAGMDQEPHSVMSSEGGGGSKGDESGADTVESSLLNDSSLGAVSDEVSDELIDQLIGQMESNTIDAAEAIDSLDLGFGLDGLELLDTPTDRSDSAQGDRPDYGLESDIERDLLEQMGGDPITLSSLDAPLDPATNIQVDEDEADVDRLLQAINDGQDLDADTMSAEGMNLLSNRPLLSHMDNGIADVSQEESDSDDTSPDSDGDSAFLLQELSAELHDDILGAELLEEEDADRINQILTAPPGPEVGDRSSVNPSFLINTAQDYGENPFGTSLPLPLASDAPSFELLSTQPLANGDGQDFYATFDTAAAEPVAEDGATGDRVLDGGMAIASDSVSSDLRQSGPEDSTFTSLASTNADAEDGNASTVSSEAEELSDELIPDGLIPDELIPDELIPDDLLDEPDADSAEGWTDAAVSMIADIETSYPSRPRQPIETINRLTDLIDYSPKGAGPTVPPSRTQTTYRSPNGSEEPTTSPDGDRPNASPTADSLTPATADTGLAGLDLRLDVDTMRQVANELSGELSGEAFSKGEFTNDERSGDSPPSSASARTNESTLETPNLPQQEGGDEGEDGLTPVSFTLQELLSGTLPTSQNPPASSPSLPFTSPADDTTPSSSPTDSDLLGNELVEEEVARNLQAGADSDSIQSLISDLEQDFGDNYEDDGVASFLEELKDKPENAKPLSGAEDAKTLADLLRSTLTPKRSSADSSVSPPSAEAPAAWENNGADGQDRVSDPEKKNNT